jgi:hypothetical protein
MIIIKIDDSGLQKFLKESPLRAQWAAKETMTAAGLHLRKRWVNHIKKAEGWPGLAQSTIERKRKYNTGAGKYRTSPLEIFERLLRVRISTAGGTIRVTAGFFNTRSFFKKFFGVGAATIAKLHEGGSDGGRYGKRPHRPIIGPVWSKEGPRMKQYIKVKFYSIFFSNKRPGIKY